MIGHLLFFQVLVIVVQARPKDVGGEILDKMAQNDANLNSGFDLDAFRTDQLNLHNHYRALHGVPAMTMDETLQSQAQEYAETLAAENNGLNHCRPPNCDRDDAGENLARAWGSTTVETNATKAWYDEIWDYNYCSHSNDRPGHDGKAVGHFTQVIWETSTKLGIGYARTSDKQSVYVVGRYLQHGNVQGQYDNNVPKASYLFKTFQDNCDGTNGDFSTWSSPGECTQSCGGGVKFQTRTCTNPKPSLNGADCSGKTRQLAAQEWCNVEVCPPEDLAHRDKQCQTRGYTANAHNFEGIYDCTLHCYLSHTTYMNRGDVDDGTHCNSDSGVCVSGKCIDMPGYVTPTTPPPTNAAGSITGGYTGTPSSNLWDNLIFTVPNAATNVLITNNAYNSANILVGYKTSTSQGYEWAESWMDSYFNFYGEVETTGTVKGVSFDYARAQHSTSTIKIAGPVNPDTGYNLVLFLQGSSQADISWTYDSS